MDKRLDSINTPPLQRVGLLDFAVPLTRHLKLLLLLPLLFALLTLGATFLIRPTFTAVTTFLPPQQQGSAAALASLGALGGIATAAGGIKQPGDQYVALMGSKRVADALIDEFRLMQVYEVELRTDARRELARNVRVFFSKKDGLITAEVDDHDATRAANMANKYLDALRRLSADLALTEAQQRRVFFQEQLQQASKKLGEAQRALQSSGFDAAALQSEPKAAAEAYARLKAEVTAAEIKLQTLRSTFTDDTPELIRHLETLSALRSQLARLASTNNQVRQDVDYVTRYREFKYQETLFDLLARQYEVARIDESRDGSSLQVVDKATPPERKSSPRRGAITVGAYLLSLMLVSTAVLLHAFWWTRCREQRNKLRAAWSGS